MIKDSVLTFKLLKANFTYEFLQARHFDSLAIEKLECPSCHCRGNCRSHGFYTRNLITLSHGHPQYTQVEVQRVKCTGCNHTHSLLADVLIPYQQYSLTFVLTVLHDYFLHTNTVEEICRQAQITPSTLYRWKKAFLDHKAMWLGILKDLEISASQYIQELFSAEVFSDLLHLFYQKFQRFFMQTHANYRRRR